MKEWKASQPGDLRQVGFLPFPLDDVMCPGETKALHLYEVRRFEDVNIYSDFSPLVLYVCILLLPTVVPLSFSPSSDVPPTKT